MTSDNRTSNTSQPSPLSAVHKNIHTFSLIVYCLIFMFGTVGNALVIYVTGFRMKKTVNSVWFLNLALADFLFTAFLIISIISLSQNHRWVFGPFLCKFTNFVNLVNMFASVFLLTTISLDRCLSICVVVWAQNKRTVRKAQLICVVIWVTAAICSTPYATFRAVREIKGVSKCVYPSDMSFEQKRILHSFRFIVGFLTPFLAIVVSHIAIGIRVRRLHRVRKQRSRRIILSVIFAFFFCWLPFHVMIFIEMTAGRNPGIREFLKIGGPVTGCLAFMNSCLNPILYVFMCDEFQKKLKKSLCFVLESALAEDHLSFMSSRSLSSQFTRLARKSDSVPPGERKEISTSTSQTDSKVQNIEETVCNE